MDYTMPNIRKYYRIFNIFIIYMENIGSSILNSVEIDQLIMKLKALYSNKEPNYFNFTEDIISKVCISAINTLKNQESMICLKAPINVAGNIHGQFNDLLNIFQKCGYPNEFKYVFLGDYVDGGKQSLETVILLLLFKIRYPENITLLRGNHESSNVNSVCGFYEECQKRVTIKAWRLICETFMYFPFAAIIDEKILCLHGGLSPNLQNINLIKNIKLPINTPDNGLACDLVWADPCDELVEDFGFNERGISYNFSAEYTKKFMKENGIDLIVRAHQVVEEGYEFFADHHLITLFSVPNYLGYLNNKGSVMIIDENLMCNFTLFKNNSKSIHKKYSKEQKKYMKLL